jgi:hypothetical protein
MQRAYSWDRVQRKDKLEIDDFNKINVYFQRENVSKYIERILS